MKQKHSIIIVLGSLITIGFLAVLFSTHHQTTISQAQAPEPVKEIKIPTTTPPTFPQPTSSLIHLPILMYHHIGYLPSSSVDSVRKGLTVSPEEFSDQVNWLKENGYNSINLSDLYLFSQHKFNLPPKPVIFTFDDGYDDVFQNTIPILKSAGYTGSFAVITDFPGTQSGTNNYATWDQITAAKNTGMEIICHTQNHFDGSNTKFSADYISQNIKGCQQSLADHLGATEPFLIYPYGHYSAIYLDQMRAAGMVLGLTVKESSWVNIKKLLEIPRVRVNPNETMEKFIEKLGQ